MWPKELVKHVLEHEHALRSRDRLYETIFLASHVLKKCVNCLKIKTRAQIATFLIISYERNIYTTFWVI